MDDRDILMDALKFHGKGNIRKLGYGKFVLTLVEVKTGRKNGHIVCMPCAEKN